MFKIGLPPSSVIVTSLGFIPFKALLISVVQGISTRWNTGVPHCAVISA